VRTALPLSPKDDNPRDDYLMVEKIVTLTIPNLLSSNVQEVDKLYATVARLTPAEQYKLDMRAVMFRSYSLREARSKVFTGK
jgi:hypothetical protein